MSEVSGLHGQSSSATSQPRHEGSDVAVAYRFGVFQVDISTRRLLRDGECIPLTPKAFDTLLVSGPRTADGAGPLSLTAVTQRVPTHYRGRWAHPMICLLLGAVIGAAVVGGGWRATVSSDSRPSAGLPVRFTQDPPNGTTLLPGVGLSPDGHYLAFIARTLASKEARLWIRSVESGAVREIAGTDGAERPFWHPSSNVIGFFANGVLKTVDLGGALPQTVTTVGLNPQGGAWNASDVILFAPWRSSLQSVSVSGGHVTPVTTLEHSLAERAHTRPQFLPDGRHFLFTVQTADTQNSGTFVGSLDSRARVRLVDASLAAAVLVPPDRLLGLRDTSLMTAGFDPSTLALRGSPVRLPGVVVPPGFLPRAGLSASEVGLLAFGGAIPAERLVWYTRDGKVTGGFDNEPIVNLVFSPDKRRLATVGLESHGGVWLLDLQRRTSTRIHSDGLWPVWSPDGTALAFSTNPVSGMSDIYLRALAGKGKDTLLLRTSESKVLNDWSRDGRYLLYTITNAQKNQELWLLPMVGDRNAVPYLQGRFSQIQAQVSPDGKWLAYTSDESGRWEVYVQSFPVPGNKRMISVGGGGEPKWRADGRELFFIRSDDVLMSVAINSGDPTKGVGRPQSLFSVPVVGETSTYRSRYGVFDDGTRFLFHIVQEMRRPAITFVANWTALDHLAPVH
jgi:Tol biopolymer transport system component